MERTADLDAIALDLMADGLTDEASVVLERAMDERRKIMSAMWCLAAKDEPPLPDAQNRDFDIPRCPYPHHRALGAESRSALG